MVTNATRSYVICYHTQSDQLSNPFQSVQSYFCQPNGLVKGTVLLAAPFNPFASAICQPPRFMVRTISDRIPCRYHHIITIARLSQGNPFCSFFVSRLSAGHLFLDPIWFKTGWSQHKIVMPRSIPVWSELKIAFYVSTQRTTFLFWTIINVQNRILLPSPKIDYFIHLSYPDPSRRPFEPTALSLARPI